MNTPLDSYIAGVESLAQRAARKHGPLATMGHGYGLLLEEIDEYFEEVRKKEGKHDQERMAEECIDIGCVALRCLIRAGLDPERMLELAEDKIINGPPTRPHHAYYSMMFGTAVGLAQKMEADKNDVRALLAILGIAGAAYISCHEIAVISGAE